MSEYLQNAVSELEAQLPQLERQRVSDAFVNDLYEAVRYWCHLGRWVLQENTKVNYPERVRGERELLGKLKSVLAKQSLEAQAKYGPLLIVGEEVLRIVGATEPPKDGHLGFLRIVRECFQFLLIDFDFSVTEEQPTSLRLSSRKVYLELQYSSDAWMSCQFGPELFDQGHFSVYDLLFLYGDQRYRIVPEKLTMSTAAEVQEWFQFIAGVFKQYGRDVLSNQPSVFDRLTNAQARRDAEYVAVMNRLHGVG